MSLGGKVAHISRSYATLMLHPLSDNYPIFHQAPDFERVVGHQPDLSKAQFFQHLRGNVVLAPIGWESEQQISIKCVMALIL